LEAPHFWQRNPSRASAARRATGQSSATRAVSSKCGANGGSISDWLSISMTLPMVTFGPNVTPLRRFVPGESTTLTRTQDQLFASVLPMNVARVEIEAIADSSPGDRLAGRAVDPCRPTSQGRDDRLIWRTRAPIPTCCPTTRMERSEPLAGVSRRPSVAPNVDPRTGLGQVVRRLAPSPSSSDSGERLVDAAGCRVHFSPLFDQGELGAKRTIKLIRVISRHRQPRAPLWSVRRERRHDD